MSTNDHLLLGFDAREMWLGPKADRPESDRICFFLRQDVIKQLSVDTTIWSSVFQEQEEEEENLPRTHWFVGIHFLRDNLEALQTHMLNFAKPYWNIAITLLTNLCEGQELAYWEARAYNILPAVHDPSWKLLGYDVADQGLLSGLTNCGFDKETEDIAAFRQRYVPHLNSYHLLDSTEIAISFRDLSNERVKEHAPFYIFAIWHIK